MGEVLTRSELPRQREDSSVVQRRYDRIARAYDLLEGSMELLALTRWRRLLWARVGDRSRRVLEVGVGTGKNLPLWPAGADITAIDLSERMLERARRRARALGLSPRLERMDVEALELPDDGFDAAVASFVFCPVADPLRGLRELRRVLRPGGRLLLLEHQRSESPLVARVLDVLDPLLARIWGARTSTAGPSRTFAAQASRSSGSATSRLRGWCA